MNRIPENMETLFWEYDPRSLSLEQDRNLIIGRLLSTAGWDGIQWLRTEIGDSELRDWIISTKGRNISPPRLRFWELLLDLPHSQVTQWLSGTNRKIWDDRSSF